MSAGDQECSVVLSCCSRLPLDSVRMTLVDAGSAKILLTGLVVVRA
jgi:hypothetical protein